MVLIKQRKKVGEDLKTRRSLAALTVEPEPGSTGVYFSLPRAWPESGAPARIVLGDGCWPSSDLPVGRVDGGWGGSGFRQGPPCHGTFRQPGMGV